MLTAGSIKSDVPNPGRLWDAVIVGAGPAGAMAAYKLAQEDKAVLLIDKAAFPRRKVCGCCLNGWALTSLAEEGMENLTTDLNAIPLDELILYTEGSKAELKLPAAQSLSREALDSALVHKAVEAGAHFMPEAPAAVGKVRQGARLVHVRHNDEDLQLRGRVVIAADGIAGRALEHLPEFRPVVSARSRVGAGAIVEESNPFYEPGKIYMACGAGGYLGLVRLEDNRLDVAAAFDLKFSRKSGGPAQAAMHILEEVGLPPIKAMASAVWHGTAALTRRRPRIAGERLFIIGDSASYAEPFTGEGIAWALISARAIAPLALQAMKHWSSALIHAWREEHARVIGKRQTVSQQIATVLRLNALTKVSARVLETLPSLAAPIVRHISMPEEHRE